MNFLRHHNGNGRIYGDDAFICARTYMDKSSSVRDSADVCCSILAERSSVTGNARVCHGSLVRSLIRDNARVVGARYIMAWDAVIADHATVVSPTSGMPVWITGKPDDPIILNRRMWVHESISVTPRYVEVQSGNVIVGITECTNGRAHVGCRCETIDHWLKIGKDYGRVAGWAPESVNLLRGVFEAWANEMVTAA